MWECTLLSILSKPNSPLPVEEKVQCPLSALAHQKLSHKVTYKDKIQCTSTRGDLITLSIMVIGLAWNCLGSQNFLLFITTSRIEKIWSLFSLKFSNHFCLGHNCNTFFQWAQSILPSNQLTSMSSYNIFYFNSTALFTMQTKISCLKHLVFISHKTL